MTVSIEAVVVVVWPVRPFLYLFPTYAGSFPPVTFYLLVSSSFLLLVDLSIIIRPLLFFLILFSALHGPVSLSLAVLLDRN